LQTTINMPAEEVADLIQDTVTRWSPTQSDDLTVLVCDYKGA
jgi:sigma-B regulation protein RsbU (phosphoserine phosphatase)